MFFCPSGTQRIMTPYVSTVSIDEVVARLRRSRRCLVTTHAKPDGDAVGAVVALVTALCRCGVEASGRLMPPVPAYLKSLVPPDTVAVYTPDQAIDPVDLVVVVDTGAWAQLEPMRAWLEPNVEKMMLIDHHLVGDVPAPWRWIDSHAAACCEMLVSLIDRLEADGGAFDDSVIRDAIYVGIATDTGWFRFSNTHAGTHLAAARLVEAGVDHARLHQGLEQNARPAKLRLLAAALHNSRWIADERAVVMTLRQDDFRRAGAESWETERLVDIPQMVGSVEVVVLVTETTALESDRGRVRLSFRSKPGPGAIDVACLAGAFGGGGHARAAGGRQPGPLEGVVERVCQAVSEVITGSTALP